MTVVRLRSENLTIIDANLRQTTPLIGEDGHFFHLHFYLISFRRPT